MGKGQWKGKRERKSQGTGFGIREAVRSSTGAARPEVFALP